MPIIRVEMLEGRSAEAKEKFITAVTANAVEILEVRPEQVRVLLYELPPAHWGIAGQSVAERNRSKDT